jgi:hypothetical protein
VSGQGKNKSLGLYSIETIHQLTGKPLLLTLSGKYLTPIRDRKALNADGTEQQGALPKMDKAEKAAYYHQCLKSGKSGSNGMSVSRGSTHNRSSVKLAYLNFVRQFKLKLVKKSDIDHIDPKGTISVERMC